MTIQVRGQTSNIADVDSNGRLLVSLPATLSTATPSIQATEVDSGSVVGAPVRRNVSVDSISSMQVGLLQTLFDEVFTYSLQPYSLYSAGGSTMTVTFATSGAVLNANSTLTTTTYARVYTYRYFQFKAGTVTRLEVRAGLALAPVAGNAVILGFENLPGSITQDPQDGVYFRYSTAGLLQGVVRINNSELTTASLSIPAAGVAHEFAIEIGDTGVEFWIDDVLQGIITLPTSAVNISTFRGGCAVFHTVNVSATSSAQQLRLYRAAVLQKGSGVALPGHHSKAVMGYMAAQGPTGSGNTPQTANRANSAAPANATLSNTAAGYTTLGGGFAFAAVAGAETDYALFAYQVPSGGAAQPGRSLVITGVNISTYNTGAAVATTATVLEWFLGIGATAVSLATADSAVLKGPRRVALGVQSLAVGAAIGARDTDVNASFRTPYVCYSGEYLHIILRMPIGTATASQVIRGAVRVEGYWE